MLSITYVDHELIKKTLQIRIFIVSSRRRIIRLVT